MANFEVIYICDSRGKGMQMKVTSILAEKGHNNIIVRFEPHSGATIKSIEQPAITLVQERPYHVIVLMVGVNSLTNLHWYEDGPMRRSRISPMYNEVGNMVDNIVLQYESLKQTLSKFTSQPIVFTELIGASYAQWNKTPGDYADAQLVMNEAVPLINQALSAMNLESGLPGPHLQNSILELNDGQRYPKYKRIPDGIHADNKTAKLWAKLIAKNAITMERIYLETH